MKLNFLIESSFDRKIKQSTPLNLRSGARLLCDAYTRGQLRPSVLPSRPGSEFEYSTTEHSASILFDKSGLLRAQKQKQNYDTVEQPGCHKVPATKILDGGGGGGGGTGNLRSKRKDVTLKARSYADYQSEADSESSEEGDDLNQRSDGPFRRKRFVHPGTGRGGYTLH